MKHPSFLLALILPLACCVRATANTNIPPRPGLVKQIDVVSKRVKTETIRNELALKEGEPFTQERVEESKKNLHRLGLLKTLDIKAEWDEALGGYRVTVKAEDGWFFLPFPMFGWRGGETYGALILMEKNYFRRSEGIMVYASYIDGRAAGMGALMLPHFSVFGGGTQERVEEYEYEDGGYNAKQFDDGDDGEEPEDFGTVTNRYKKDMDSVFVFVGGRVAPWVRASGGLGFSEVAYHDAASSEPGDEGRFATWGVNLDFGREGRGDPGSQGGMFGSVGRVFGLGMAGVKDSLKPLPKIEFTRSLGVSFERGEIFLGSDEEFTQAGGSVRQSVLFRDRSRLSLSVKGGWGDDLPPSRRLSTGERGYMQGVYAREYRGDRIAAASASYSRGFFRNMVGQLTAEVFGDAAWCWADDEQWEKQGAGFSLFYRFWRFPLPFGGSTTYSFDDENWQFSFAVGGMY